MDGIEGPQIAQVAVGHNEVDLAGDQLVDAFLDRDAAGQARDGVGIAGRLDLHRGDFPEQVLAPGHAQVTAVPGEDEALQEMPGIRGGHDLGQFVQAHVVVHDQGLGVHDVGARGAGTGARGGPAGHDPDRNGVGHYRDGLHGRIHPEGDGRVLHWGVGSHCGHHVQDAGGRGPALIEP
jgi:hypothetical protein